MELKVGAVVVQRRSQCGLPLFCRNGPRGMARVRWATAPALPVIGAKSTSCSSVEELVNNCASARDEIAGACGERRIRSHPFDASRPSWVPRSHRSLRARKARRTRSTSPLPGSARDIYPWDAEPARCIASRLLSSHDTMMLSALTFAILGLSSLAVAHDPLAPRQGYGYGGGSNSGHGGDDGSNTNVAATSTAAAAGASGTAVSAANTSGLKGGSVCSDLMCISGVVNGSTVQYVLQSKGSAPLGWMAMGFGNQMANTPMVIMWNNSDGTVTLSQRKAPSEVMPTVDANPPRVATPDTAASDLSGTLPKLSFTIPADGTSATSQTIIWAFGNVNPESSADDATLLQHLESNPITIDMSQSLTAADVTNLASPAADPTTTTDTSSPPLLPYQKKIVAHALLCTIGFLILLPAGALLARYARTFTNTWFTGHWAFQLAFAGPVIIAGVALGISAVATAGAKHLDDDHKKWGVAIFALYFVQITLGAVIHYVKPTSFTVGKRRPMQNYIHAVLGLIIIALAFYQVRTGFRTEWVAATGRNPISNSANIVWYVWVVLVPVLYFAGLAFLPRQFRMERPHQKAPSDEFTQRYSD